MSKIKKLIVKKSATSSVWFRIYWKLHNINLQRQMRLTDEEYARQSYESATGRVMDLANPKYFAEKLWWLKLYYRNPLQTKCADKYAVREYVKDCGLEHILNDIYGIYSKVDDIDFKMLRSPCFIKCTSGSGYNTIFDRNKNFDKRYFKTKFDLALEHNYYYDSREWPYNDVLPKIMVENVLYDENGKLPVDYKFFCFNGKVKLAYINIDVSNEDGTHAEGNKWDLFDCQFNKLDINILENGNKSRNNYINTQLIKPNGWEKMIEYANILGAPFPHCRVDFYYVKERIYFGEITFFHCGGSVVIEPEVWDSEIGSWIDLDIIDKEYILEH